MPIQSLLYGSNLERKEENEEAGLKHGFVRIKCALFSLAFVMSGEQVKLSPLPGCTLYPFGKFLLLLDCVQHQLGHYMGTVGTVAGSNFAPGS